MSLSIVRNHWQYTLGMKMNPQCQMNKHSLIHSTSLVNCSRFYELACIINYHTKNVRVFVLSWEATCVSFLACSSLATLLRSIRKHTLRGMMLAANVGRNYNWDLFHLLHREKITSGMYFVIYLWHSEFALKSLKRVTLLLFGFSSFFFFNLRQVILESLLEYNKYGHNRKFTSLKKR